MLMFRVLPRRSDGPFGRLSESEECYKRDLRAALWAQTY
jgi:hypothetical protein